MIQKRLSELSSSEDWFKPEVTEYNESLKAAEYSPTLEFIYPDKPNNIQTISKQYPNNIQIIQSNSKKKSRKRKIIWFNPPYNERVTNNVAKNFLKLILLRILSIA